MTQNQPDNQPTEFPPLIFPCRWRYSPGMFCSVPVTPPDRFCDLHAMEDAARLAALKEAKTDG